MAYKKTRHEILEWLIGESDYRQKNMKLYEARDYYRKLFTKGGPLSKYYKDIDEVTYRKILNEYGELILQKIMNAEVFDFPVENAGRITVYQRELTKKHYRYYGYKPYLYYIYWNKKKFKGGYYAFCVPTIKCKSFFNKNLDKSKSYYCKMKTVRP